MTVMDTGYDCGHAPATFKPRDWTCFVLVWLRAERVQADQGLATTGDMGAVEGVGGGGGGRPPANLKPGDWTCFVLDWLMAERV